MSDLKLSFELISAAEVAPDVSCANLLIGGL